jgi:hypothetical protein
LDQCHGAGVCDPTSGACSNPVQPDGTACSDGNACTRVDTCESGICTGANPVVCPAATDQCQVAGSCDPSSGMCGSTSVAPDGTACNDSNACTMNDQCASGACGGTPVVCPVCPSGNNGICNPITGSCVCD